MARGALELVKDGYKYMNLWPEQPSLYVLFKECRVIRMTKFLLRTLPPIILISLFVQFNLLPRADWAAAVSVILFLISLPLQSLIWLGMRAHTTLPRGLSQWYVEISEKMRENGMQVQGVENPVYGDMAVLLKQAFGQLDKVSLQRLF